MILALLACGGSPPPPPPTVVLVVLDTVRADHLSACGYDRPTSPFLAELSGRGTLVCDAVAPASWTVPSHATFFTGLTPPEHGVAFVDGGVRLHKDIHVRPLDPSFETIAERYAARGYQTVLVSGNRVVGETAGLAQGFDQVRTAARDGAQLRGTRLPVAVRTALASLDPARPLFLVVNVFDAHDPWPAIGADVGWLPPRERVAYHHDDETSPYVRFHRGTLEPAAREAWLALVRDQYDHGVRRADDALRDVIAALDEGGWTARPHRIVVTADHGELLGEHDRLRHGGNLWEENLRVPLLWLESPGPRPALDGPVSGREVFSLLDAGRRAPGSVVAWTEPAQAHPSPGAWGVARYDGARKVIVGPDGGTVFDLASDPREASGRPGGETPADRAALDVWRAWASRPLPAEGEGDGDALRALGYVE